MKEISAGGVVYRRTEENVLQIQLIQDRYGKVSLPKGRWSQAKPWSKLH